MKSFLFFLGLLASSLCLTNIEYAEQAGITLDEALQLVSGILNATNVKHEIDHLQNCFDRSPSLIKGIIDFINDISHMKWNDPEKIIELFAHLFGDLKELLEMIKPCSKVAGDVKVIIEKIKKMNFEQLMDKIMTRMWEIFTTMTDCIRHFQAKQFFDAGEALGRIIYLLILEDPKDHDEAFMNVVEDFFRGFFKGLGADNEWNEIKKCINGAEAIIKRIVEAVQLIITLDPKKVFDGVVKLIGAVTDLIKMINPCLSATSILKKLLEKIISVNVWSLVWHIITHIVDLIKDIRDIIEGFAKQNFEQVGHGLGGLLKSLFL